MRRSSTTAEGGALNPGAGEPSRPPGQVIAIEGIVFQCDADDLVSGLFIRPLQHLSRRLRGRSNDGRPHDAGARGVPLANHAGIRVRVLAADGKTRRYVVEQLNGTLRQNLVNGLSWTRWREFRAREGGGWDVTVPAFAFEGIQPTDVAAALHVLNREAGQPFFSEVCTAFIERVFGKRLFDQVEILDRLVPGPGPRIPEPSAPRFKPDAHLSRRARHLLRSDELRMVHVELQQAAAAEQSDRPVDATLAGGDAARRLTRGALKPGLVWYWLASQAGRLCR
ncbi:MAG: hypothetical protein M3069_13170 [Chloroflexota bacterium]|nr:hypothetical protein [Chloroflexota bacterium]